MVAGFLPTESSIERCLVVTQLGYRVSLHMCAAVKCFGVSTCARPVPVMEVIHYRCDFGSA